MERQQQDGTEWLLGAVSVDLAPVPLTLRLAYAPDGVLQYNNIFDTNGCASRSPINYAEAKLNYLWDNGMHPALKEWFEKNGYRKDNRFLLSDAFIEILSGTGPNGNSMKAPVDAIYRYGLIPQHLLPLEEGMTREDYFNPDRITAEMLRLGKEFLRRVTFNYEKVLLADFMAALETDYLCVAGHGWSEPKNGIYPRTEAPFQHAWLNMTPTVHALDNYTPFVKTLAKDYKYFEWGYSLSITSQNPFPDETVSLFETLKKFNLLAYFATALVNFLKAMTNSNPESVTEPTPPVTPPPAPEPEKPKPAGDEKLIAALIQVESGGNDNAIGDKNLTHKAYGCLQIRQPFCDDVNRVYGSKLKAQDMLGNRALSIDTVRKYWTIYKCKTDEEKARVVNGGPSAKRPGSAQYKATNGYWARVKARL